MEGANRNPKPVGGVSLKVSRTPQLVDITQFQYMLASDTISGGAKCTGTIWYDGSNVGCKIGRCPFEKEGVNLALSDMTCPSRRCKPGEKPCKSFYTLWNDDVNSLDHDFVQWLMFIFILYFLRLIYDFLRVRVV
jgi:hypothetical protein